MTTPPPPEEIDDPAVLKALAHPLRRRILERLRRGPASATTLARELGENTGVTSYHLRELAKHGFLEDAPDLGRGKERWWRIRPRDLRYPRRSEQSAELRAVLDDVHGRKLAEDLELWSRFLRHRDQLGEWGDAPVARGSLHLTPDELRRFFDEYMALFRRYWRPDQENRPEARRVVVRFAAFPDPDES